MSDELNYKELIYSKEGPLVVQVKKGYFQLRHHSGLPPYVRCFRSKAVAMEAFDILFPMQDWTRPASYWRDMYDSERDKLHDKVCQALGHLKSVKMPEED